MSEIFNEYLFKLKDLVQCNTVSDRNHLNEKNASVFFELLKKNFPEIFTKCIVKDIYGNLVIEYIGKRSTAPALFLCHYDTAEIKGDWEHDPLSAYVDERKIFGRGVLDAKGNLFSILEAINELIKEGYVPSQDVYVAILSDSEGENKAIEDVYNYFKNSSVYFSYVMDEGGFVVNPLLKGLNKDYAVVGLGEQASAILKIKSFADGGHTSFNIKNTALLNLIYFIDEFSGNDVFKKSIHKSLHNSFALLSKDMEGFKKFVFANSKIFSPFVKSYLKNEPLVHNTIQSSLSFVDIHGSDYDKTISSEVYAICNLRIGLNDTLKNCLKKINKIAKYYNLQVEVLKEYDLSRITNDDSYQYAEIEDAVKEVFNAPVLPCISPITTNSRIMERLTGNCFRFNPFKVTSEQVLRIHGIDENIDVDSLEKAVNFYKHLIKN